MPDKHENFEPTSFVYETVDPEDTVLIGKLIEDINAEEGPLVILANGNADYLRFLRDDAIAQLDRRVYPNDEAIYERALRTHDALEAYEESIRGIT